MRVPQISLKTPSLTWSGPRGRSRLGLGPRNDVLTSCKLVNLHGGHQSLENIVVER